MKKLRTEKEKKKGRKIKRGRSLRRGKERENER